MKNYETATEFVKVEPEQIAIAQPPDPTAEGYDPTVYQFSNPRGRAKGGGFDKEPMKELETSIIRTGLQQPLLLRQLDAGPQLVAGERRLQAILNIKKRKKNGKPITVFNINTKEMEPVTKVYKTVFVRIMDECSEEDALGLAVEENENSQPLTVQDQVNLVEGMLATGTTPNEICKRLGKNPAWVNHTSHFRDSLPESCFGALMAGDINRHIATELLKYPEEDRDEIWAEAMSALTGKREKKKKELEDNVTDAAGEVEVADATATLASELDLDKDEAAQAQADATNSLEDAQGELEDFQENPTSMTGGDINEAGGTTGHKPTTPQAFNKKKIEKHYMDPLREALGMMKHENGGWSEPDDSVKFKDTITGKNFPRQLLQCALDIADGIVSQDADVFEVLREHLFDTGKWDRPDEDEVPTNEAEEAAAADAAASGD
tara:strand:- start:396 stop:1700 length:1305 start_codon:yes stop_codon:yes gene_type:complete